MSGAYDAIVIGSGIAGLTCAAFLSKKGQRVLVLEQHYVPGGFCHTFRRRQFLFDAGVDYIGSCGDGQDVNLILRGLGLAEEVGFVEMDPDGFDRLIFPDAVIPVPKGAARFCAELQARFPTERDGLARYFRVLEGLWEERRRLAEGMPTWEAWGHRTLADLFEETIADPGLRTILAGQTGNYALPPSRASLIVHGLIAMHYHEGAYYPRGGVQVIPDALVRCIEKQGGEVRLRSLVERILIRDRQAIGVRLAGGEEIPAGAVVSNADIKRTFGELIEPEHISPRLRARVRALEPSLATFGVYLGVRADLAAMGLGSPNYWLYAGYDLERDYATIFAGGIPDPLSLFVTVPTLKDPTGGFAPPGHHTLTLLTFIAYNRFAPWRDRPLHRRGPEYRRAKAALAARCVGRAEALIPGLGSSIVCREIGTPLTNESYSLTSEGAVYGLAKTPGQLALSGAPVRREIKDLHIAGPYPCHGVLGCMLSGLSVASRIVGRDLLRRVMAGSPPG